MAWAPRWAVFLESGDFDLYVHGRDAYRVEDIDYVFSFRPQPGLLKTLPNLKTIFSLGAGVDGFLIDPEFPRAIALVRFVDPQLTTEMAQYVVMQVLLHHRRQRVFDAAQARSQWAQMPLPRRTADTRIGVLGLGEIGTACGARLRDLGFAVSGWSRTRKQVDGIMSYAGETEMEAFFAASDILVCLLPLTPQTRGILCARTFALLPKGAFVINVARGGHLIEADLVAAIDGGHLAGAALDVFQVEPLPEASPLWRHPQIVVTPHIAAISDPRVAADYVIDGIARAERGESHPNVVDVDRGY